MDLPIRPVELDRAAQTAALRRVRGDKHDEQPFELDPEARRERRPREEPAEREPVRDDELEQRIAPRASDEVGSHLDVTA